MTNNAVALVLAEQTPDDSRAHATRIAMRDGVELATDIYHPGPGIRTAPTVLIRLPYDKTGHYTFIPPIAEHFAAHGYVCVTQDVRGKYRSDGERFPFVHEADDAWDTVEWIQAQSWSDGVVGTWGDSYYGFTQWALASRHHPAHRAMVPRVTGHRFFDMRPGGGAPSRTLLKWVIDTWSLPEFILEHSLVSRRDPLLESVNPALAPHAHLIRRFQHIAAGPEAFAAEVFPDGDPARALTIPALHMGGWFDNLQYWQLDDWYAALESPAAEHQYLRMSSGDHEDYGWREPGAPNNDDFGGDPDALARHIRRLLAEPLSFFDHYLRGGRGRWAAPTVAYEHIRRDRMIAPEWPPARTRELVLCPRADARLGHEAPDTPERVTWTHDADDPVPFPVSREWDQNREGVPDESALHARRDVAVFTTPPMESPLDLVGPVELAGVIRSPESRTLVVARVLDVHPDGRAHLILGNAVDASGASAGDEIAFRVRLGDTAYRLPPGHALRLAVSSSLAGQFDEVAPSAGAETRAPEARELELHRTRLVLGVDRA